MKNYIYTERVDLYEPKVYIQYLIQITGNPTPDALVSAIKTAFAANEATMSRIVQDKNGDAFYEKMSESGCKVSISKDDWKNILRQNEKMPFAIDKGELMRVYVIVNEDNLFLFIMAHHLVGDGKAVTYFIEDVMTALSGKSLVYKPIQLITQKSLPKESDVSLLVRLSIHNINKKWKRTGQVFQWDDYYKIHKTYWKEHSSEVIFEYFSPEEITKIHDHAKEIGVTVNSYIIAAFLEANRVNKNIGISVNIRLDKNKSLSNQVSGISVKHSFSDKMTFDKNVKIIHKKVLDALAKPARKYYVLRAMPLFDPNLLDSVLLYTYRLYQNKITEKLASIMGYAGEKTRELGISNLTRLDIPDTYGAYGLKNGLFIPPVISYANHIIGISTMADGMNISYHFMSNQDKEKEIQFFKRAIRNLKMNI